ncbi:MAG: hypothetical protein DRH04_10890 [Deltaproteobacteria bacterium]|nr:MAG: hypothetical protein DRH04_10890 [Deltaproteobacteria bacterium]
MWYESGGKYYDGNKLHVKYTGSGGDPREAKYELEDLTPQLVVYGHLYCKDRNLNYEPVKWATVYLYDYDYSDGSYDNLSSAVLTNETGYFEFSPVENVDWDEDGGKLDISVQFIAGSGTGCVRDANNETYRSITDPYPDASGSKLSVTHYLPNDITHYKAWWVYDTLCEGWDYLADTVNYGMAGVGVYWQWDHDADYGTGINITHGHGNASGLFIFLDGKTGDDGGSANDPDVIIHEYGHGVMYKVFGDYMPPHDCSQGHWMTGISEPGCAWVEGWAHFSALAVFNDKYFTDTTYWVGPGTDTANLETRNGNLNFPDGDSCEGNIAAALWDINDSHNEDYDNLTADFSEIWDVLQDQTTDEDTFRDFYDSWCDLGHDKSKANAAIFQNRINYNSPPGIVVTVPEALHDYAKTITIAFWTTDTDGFVFDVAIFYSRDNINWNQLDLPLKSGGYSTRGEEKWWYVDWDTTLCIDEDDTVWLRVNATDNLDATSSDDTDGPFTVDNVASHHWRYFTPTDWVADQTPDCTIEVKDVTAGLDVSTAHYKYSTDGGSTWSGWIGASCTGSDGTTSYQTITAGSVPFYQDSGTQNRIKFKIDDVVGNTGESGEYTVKIDSTNPQVSVRIRITHHYGDTSDYNGVPMFNLVKAVPEGSSPLDLLQSVADVTMYEGRVYSINGINESPPYYWYLYINGIPAPDEDIDTYQLRDGEIVHWDYSSMINAGEGEGGGASGSYSAMNHPEPSTSDIVKLIPEGSTPLDLLKSVADVTMHEGRIYSINGVTESPPYYWHIYINDIQVLDEDIDSYQLRGGEVIHWARSNVGNAGE